MKNAKFSRVFDDFRLQEVYRMLLQLTPAVGQYYVFERTLNVQ
jgi:hypothetical protein